MDRRAVVGAAVDKGGNAMATKPRLGRRSALGLASAAAITPRARAAPSEVKFAMIMPLSGPWARSGLLEQMGARMAVDDVNAAGGIKSLGGAKLTMVEFDAGDSSEKAKDAAQRMLAQEPDLAGGFGAWLSSFTSWPSPRSPSAPNCPG